MDDTLHTDDEIIMDKMTHEVPTKAELEEMEEIWKKPEIKKPKRFTPAELWNIQRNIKRINIYRV